MRMRRKKRKMRRRRRMKRDIIEEGNLSLKMRRKTMRRLIESMKIMKVMPLILKSVQPSVATTSKTVPPPSVMAREPSRRDPDAARPPSTRATSDSLS